MSGIQIGNKLPACWDFCRTETSTRSVFVQFVISHFLYLGKTPLLLGTLKKTMKDDIYFFILVYPDMRLRGQPL